MIWLFVILGIIVGTGIAWLLNKFVVGKKHYSNSGEFVEKSEITGDKIRQLTFNVAIYAVCIILAVGFFSIFNLRISLGNFLDGRIQKISGVLTEAFADPTIMDKGLDTNDFVELSNKMQQLTNDIDQSGDNFLEKMVYKAFAKKLAGYTNAAKGGANVLVFLSDDKGQLTINSTLASVRQAALKAASPFCTFLQIVILLLLAACIVIVLFVARSDAARRSGNNKSVVFGNIDYTNNNTEQHQKRE